MNIGIDIDDTITDTYETLMLLISVFFEIDLNKLLEKKLSYDQLYTMFPNYGSFVKKNYHIMARMAPLKKDVIEVLQKLKAEGHKIILISARNLEEYENPYKLSYEYLINKGVPFDKLIINVKDKGRECIGQGIDLFLDDSVHNCCEVSKMGIKTVQFESGFGDKNNKFTKVKNWLEFYDLVNNLQNENS